MMIVDDELYVFGFNYTKLDIDKSRSFGIVTKRSEAGQGGDGAVRGRQHPPAVRAEPRSAGRQPRELAQDPHGVHRRREEAAADLRRQGHRPDDGESAAGAREGRRRDPDVRQDRQGGAGRRRPQDAGAAPARPRHGARRLDGVRRQPEPAQAGAGRPPRGRRHRQRHRHREAHAGGLRGRLAEDAEQVRSEGSEGGR